MAWQWIREEMRRPIPLDDPALFRFALIRVGDDHTLWLQKYHHIIIDATGRRLLAARTAARYRALRFGEPLPALDAATPEELLQAERRYVASDAHQADRKYWLEQFTKWPGPLLEMDRRNTERARSGVHARTGFTLKRADFARLETTARALSSSAFRAIVALSYVAFARLYDRYDMVLGLELANRPNARAKQAIGLLAGRHRCCWRLIMRRRSPMPCVTSRTCGRETIRTGTFRSRSSRASLALREKGITACST